MGSRYDCIVINKNLENNLSGIFSLVDMKMEQMGTESYPLPYMRINDPIIGVSFISSFTVIIGDIYFSQLDNIRFLDLFKIRLPIEQRLIDLSKKLNSNFIKK